MELALQATPCRARGDRADGIPVVPIFTGMADGIIQTVRDCLREQVYALGLLIQISPLLLRMSISWSAWLPISPRKTNAFRPLGGVWYDTLYLKLSGERSGSNV